MNGRIAPVDGDTSQAIEFDGSAAVYRKDDGSHRVVASADGTELPLGPADVTVSRMKGAEPPVEFVARPDGVEVKNHGARNAISVDPVAGGRPHEVEDGDAVTVDRDAVVEVGHHTRLRLGIEDGAGDADVDGPTRADVGRRSTREDLGARATLPGVGARDTVPGDVAARDTLDAVAGDPSAEGAAGIRPAEDGSDVAAAETLLEGLAEVETRPGRLRERLDALDDEVAEAAGAKALVEAETAVVDCLPDGPAAAALREARTRYEDGQYRRAIERATQVRDLAEREVAKLETVRARDHREDPDLSALREESTGYGLDTGVTTAYEDLAEAASDRDAPLEGTAPPGEVPTAPDLSLSYDRIRTGKRIGSGGTADVFEATAETAGGEVRVALKEPRFQGRPAEGVIEDFEREADTWDRLDADDNVVGVIDWGTDPHPWIAMEYMDGGALTDLAGKLTPRQAIWTFLGIVRGVYHAHKMGVAHLDLKPGNVLLRRTGDDTWPVPKVADWGLAKMLLRHSRSVKGYTPLYAAPEQVDGDLASPDTSTDIYQLGAVGYALLTGEPPFSGDTSQVLMKILKDEVTPPTEVAPGLPAKVDEIVLTAMAKRREDRFEDVLYLRDELEALYEAL